MQRVTVASTWNKPHSFFILTNHRTRKSLPRWCESSSLERHLILVGGFDHRLGLRRWEGERKVLARFEECLHIFLYEDGDLLRWWWSRKKATEAVKPTDQMGSWLMGAAATTACFYSCAFPFFLSLSFSARAVTLGCQRWTEQLPPASGGGVLLVVMVTATARLNGHAGMSPTEGHQDGEEIGAWSTCVQRG